mgnify:FL=1
MLRDKMLAVMTDLRRDVVEREELIEAIAIALLTRKNLFILGDPGQAKSFVINGFRSRITGARQFERLLTKQADEEQLFGRTDLSSLIPGHVPQSVLEQDATYRRLRGELEAVVTLMPTQPDDPEAYEQMAAATERLEAYKKAVASLYRSEPMVLTTGKIPEADICFLDEAFKCNDGVLNSLLTALNERKYTNEGRTYPIPTISFFAASNEIPNFNDPQEKILAALYDRLELKVVTQNIAGRENRLRMLKAKQSGSSGQIQCTITLDELLEMQREVAAIPVPDAANELADDILCELRKNGMTVSDRKYLGYYPIAQAKAWLSGHTQVESTDLLALKNYLWHLPADRAMVESTLQRMCVNPMLDKVNDVRSMAMEARDEYDVARSDTNKAGAANRALVKLRGELLRLFEMQKKLEAEARTDSERVLTAELLQDMEQISRQAHEAVGFTYIPLEQLAALQ